MRTTSEWMMNKLIYLVTYDSSVASIFQQSQGNEDNVLGQI
jgi:hypothetical protein